VSINKATGLDNLPAIFIKDSACVPAKVITHIVNLSISSGTFPKDLKTARVVPLSTRRAVKQRFSFGQGCLRKENHPTAPCAAGQVYLFEGLV
jgi:hypothetical protein